VVRREGSGLDREALRAHLSGRVAKWWIPERIEFLDEVPKTSVGKFDKKLLRARLAGEDARVEGKQPVFGPAGGPSR
jgi:fatty-acyl-CoA synthase